MGERGSLKSLWLQGSFPICWSRFFQVLSAGELAGHASFQEVPSSIGSSFHLSHLHVHPYFEVTHTCVSRSAGMLDPSSQHSTNRTYNWQRTTVEQPLGLGAKWCEQNARRSRVDCLLRVKSSVPWTWHAFSLMTQPRYCLWYNAAQCPHSPEQGPILFSVARPVRNFESCGCYQHTDSRQMSHSRVGRRSRE